MFSDWFRKWAIAANGSSDLTGVTAPFGRFDSFLSGLPCAEAAIPE
jgi:hypothetical protein